MKSSATDRCVLITNGNLASMISITSWLKKHGNKLVKAYITKILPSEKSNVRGGLRMLKKSGWDYTYMKVWINKLFPIYLRRHGLPGSVEEFLHRYQSDDRVCVTGFVYDMPEHYSAVDLVILPTYREGFPYTPLEAAAMGLPVVATKVVGCVGK